MPITVPCLKCKTKFQVPSKLAGTTVRCQACGFMLRLPSPAVIQAKKKSPTASAAKSASGGKPITGNKSAPAPKPRPSPQTPPKNDTSGLAMFDEPFELIDTTNDAAPGKTANAASPTPEPTVLSCSHCEGLLYYDPNFANQTVACPHCGNHLVMPQL